MQRRESGSRAIHLRYGPGLEASVGAAGAEASLLTVIHHETPIN